MKLAAYGIRGKVVFVRENGRAPLGLWQFVSFTLTKMRGNRALLIGAAAAETLLRLEADLRQRRPHVPVHVLRPSLFEFLKVARHWKNYRYVSIPWTREGHNVLKLAAWLLPCGRREIYNEAGDSFSVRLVGTLAAHVGRRAMERTIALWNGVRFVAWRTGDALRAAWNGLCYAAWWSGDRALAAWYHMLAIRPGVTVIGSASGYYMKDIVAELRRKHPGEPIYGLLPARLVGPTGKLFDAVIPLAALSILGHALGRKRTGYLAIPCTNEGYNRYKLLGALLPLGRRVIYNENHDGYSVRSGSMLVEHGFWRLRHRLFYQALTERRGRSRLVVAMHLLLYPFRLMAGAAVLAGIRLRAKSKGPLAEIENKPAFTAETSAEPRVHSPQVLDVADP
jgi:hypothetical protein